jgi:hypothetical protein
MSIWDLRQAIEQSIPAYTLLAVPMGALTVLVAAWIFRRGK